ncbi:NifB/NifX family molybdenum-iron cluster-binding protein [Celerinatantimonas sp. YJH-8]|uniref:NifB/NifX family molybdenum-iron cluster-binding protein n=1 Tax=Celerinatantimonas sp. YJH-8 TaxID=3228714 RepID=UPI0038BF0D62
MQPTIDMNWLCRRYQLVKQLGISLATLPLTTPTQDQLQQLADETGVSFQDFQSILTEPLPEQWQLFEQHPPLAAKSLRCALASSDGINIDGHFSRCPVMHLYDVSADSVQLVALREMPAVPGSDGHQQRVDSLNDCQLLFIAAIGGPAAARVIRADIYPMKVRQPAMIEPTLIDLQQRLASGKLPPWLKKLIGEDWDAWSWQES